MRTWSGYVLPLISFCLATELLLIDRSGGAGGQQGYVTVIAAVLVIVAFLLLIRARQHARFYSEMDEMLRQIKNGERTKMFYFQTASLPDDRTVARAFSDAMKDVHRRFNSVLQDRVSEEAVLASMAEGVLVIDLDECVVRINAAGAQLLGAAAQQVIGRSVQETIRNVEVQKFVRALLRGDNPPEQDVELRGQGDRYLQMTGRELRGLEGTRMGGIIVLTDVTRLRRLERTRSDFIANVSHELKTPVTSIRGFAETLLDGAIDQPEDARRFMAIISRQAERLTRIFDDMLVLSKLEQQQRTDLQESELEPLVKAAAQTCEMTAAARGVKISFECMPAISAPINAALLEQAVVNLIDNAVKYSGVGTKVDVKVDRATDGRPFIAVCDNGCGIDAEHLPRIFERFYRVDRGRSRTEGGTGLGLAIVKHIAQVHGGYASVESEVGKGSRFTIYLQGSAAVRKVGT